MVRGYASTLYVINKVLRKPEVTHEHIEACRKTPFYYLLKQLFDFREHKDCRKVGDVLPGQIIKCYDANTNTFKLGEKMLKVTRRDVKVLFAIEEGSEAVPNFSKAELNEKSDWERRIFENSKIDKKGIVTAIDKVLERTDTRSIEEDFPKLMTLLSFTTLFFCEQAPLRNRKYLKHSEQLDSLKNFNWSRSILRVLVKSLRENLFKPSKVGGCVTAILGWFFEHTTIGEKKKEAINAFPRCLRWTLICKNPNYKKQVIDKLKSNQVIEKIEITDEEFEKFGIDKDEKEEEENDEEEDEEDDEEDEEDDEEDEEDEEEVKELNKNRKKCKRKSVIDESVTEEEPDEQDRRKRKIKKIQKKKKIVGKELGSMIKRKSKEQEDQEEEEDDEEYLLDSKQNEAESENVENENEVKELQKNMKQTKKRKKVEHNEKKLKRTLIDESDTEEESEKEERRKRKKKTTEKYKKESVKKSGRKMKRKSKEQDEEEVEKDVEQYKSYSEEEEDDQNDYDEQEEDEGTVSKQKMIKEKERMANEIHELNSRLISLMKESENLKQKNQEIVSDKKIADDSLRTVEAKLESMVERVQFLEKEKSDAEKEIHDLKEENKNYIAELKKLDVSYINMFNENKEMKTKLKEFGIQEFDEEPKDLTNESENEIQKKKVSEKESEKSYKTPARDIHYVRTRRGGKRGTKEAKNHVEDKETDPKDLEEEKTKKKKKQVKEKDNKSEKESLVSSMVGRLKARRAKPAAKKKEPEKVVLDSSDSDFQRDEVKEKNVSMKNTKLVKITRKMKNLKPLEAYFVKEDVEHVANLEKFGPSVEVWKKDNIIVTLKDMDNLRKGNMLEKQVVEAGFVIGQKLHDDMLVSNTQELFLNRKCDYIPNVMYYLNQIDQNEKNEVYKEEARKMVYEKWHKAKDSMTHFLMIPIYTETKKKDIGHWTLLVCNLEDEREEVWTHYNSRRESEIGNNEALRVFDYIREVCPSPTMEYESLTPVTLKFSESCPQEKNNLDCGLFVLMYANDIYKLCKVKETYSTEEVNQFRANLYSGIVKDWERTIQYFTDPTQDQSQIADVGTPP